MRVIRGIAMTGLLAFLLWMGAAPASAQTTTTLPAPLPVTGAPEPAAPDESAAADPNLATTGVELIPLVNAGMALIIAGALLLVVLEVHTSGRRQRSIWSY